MPKSPSQLTEVERNEIIEALRQGHTNVEIAQTYGLKHAVYVSVIARKAGLPPKRPDHRTNKKYLPAQNLEQQLAEANRKLAETQAHIQELRLRKETQEIRFEMADDTTVVVHGVTEHFRKLGGCARFLEFVQRHIPQVGGGE